MGMFEDNMRDMMTEFTRQMQTMDKEAGQHKDVVDMKAISRMQQTIADMTQALDRATDALSDREG